VAVGARRYAAVRDLTGHDRPAYELFVDHATGELLPLDVLQAESETARRERVAKVRMQAARAREAVKRVSGYGFEG
jgi:hypothetical protein